MINHNASEIFIIHKLGTTQVGPETNIFGYSCNGVEMAGDMYSLNTTLCCVFSNFLGGGPPPPTHHPHYRKYFGSNHNLNSLWLYLKMYQNLIIFINVYPFHKYHGSFDLGFFPTLLPNPQKHMGFWIFSNLTLQETFFQSASIKLMAKT